MIKDKLIEKLLDLIKPIVEERNYELYHVEYVKECGENYLRIYIDSHNGINLDDCEKVSRAVSDMLDAVDPIEESYYLEVSSPGIDRILFSDAHLNRYLGSVISIKMAKLFNGKKIYEGILEDFNSEYITINFEGNSLNIPRKLIKVMNLKGEF
ncbi:ribosome maturation factor RimP [Clostridium sp. SYSU_GA19001]|uniref:ribosome maturation factor RimP n=1 Tax=Clostridium caldaquaticum TaxID=2940653 RepID=UPI002077496A|nr:ribosome maturation factor RimP [Clostridium caldaquaticum]MCM8710623.1 ribosome maturation factor RimP [Clostridium caldaquaticum]